ncbi:hypothetical protein OEV98_06615 [Caldibacillus lycopersici]|uniref:Phosphoribulokinase/uridine kinase domain-containing protein n=1 Tax=Perspicuibacillus lycopersici TaxID=1325689 RepID=A0AAE3IRF8_9BACI|nr:hypothetical protein [Perspicuibacillus lycopersici]MCU9613223.1 hypothetical protein [Perspicuibacillus lycopersici]
MNDKPFVIAISAFSGGGKTTIVKQLQATLPNAAALFFDDYDFENAPEDIIDWVKEGADYNEWNLDPFVNDLHALRNDCAYILLDYPFAYQNDQMRPFIDFAIFIDTPLDVALSRRILRDYQETDSVEKIQKDIQFYLTAGRIGYLEMEQTIKRDSDAVIDGTQAPECIVKQIIAKIGGSQ